MLGFPVIFSILKFFTYCSIFFISIIKNPIYSIFSLILVFLTGSAYFFFAGAEFLAFSVIIIYIGAVAVLFLFVVIMLGDQNSAKNLGDKVSNINFKFSLYYYIFGLSLFFFFLYAIVNFFSFTFQSFFSTRIWISLWDFFSNIEVIGDVIYLYYFFPFLLCGLVLLVAMIGAILLVLSKIPSYQVFNSNYFIKW